MARETKIPKIPASIFPHLHWLKTVDDTTLFTGAIFFPSFLAHLLLANGKGEAANEVDKMNTVLNSDNNRSYKS